MDSDLRHALTTYQMRPLILIIPGRQYTVTLRVVSNLGYSSKISARENRLPRGGASPLLDI